MCISMSMYQNTDQLPTAAQLPIKKLFEADSEEYLYQRISNSNSNRQIDQYSGSDSRATSKC